MFSSKSSKRLVLAISFSTTFMIIEFVGGVIAQSLAILSDAAHLLTDIFGFTLALIACIYATSSATKFYSFGYGRAEILGALGSVLTLWGLTFYLLYSSVSRAIEWFNGTAVPVNGKLMFILACLGIIVNIVLATIFSSEHGVGMFHDHSHGHTEHGHSDHGHDHNHGKDNHSEASHCQDHDHSHNHNQEKTVHRHSPHCSHSDIEMSSTCIVNNDDHGHSHTKHEHNASNDHNHSHGHDHQHNYLGKEDLPVEADRLNVNKFPSYQAVARDDVVIGNTHGHQHENEHEDINMQAAYLHVIGDLIQSVGVAIGGLAIWIWPQYQIIDPCCSFLFSGLVLWYI